MTRTRQSSDFTDVNALGMYYFRMGGIETDPSYPYPTLQIHGDKGYAGFLVTIRFLETVYLACIVSFDYSFIWRMATDEEAARMYAQADEDRAKVYCIEEDISLYRTPLNREARKFFIVARGVEITLSYSESHEESISKWGQPIS